MEWSDPASLQIYGDNYSCSLLRKALPTYNLFAFEPKSSPGVYVTTRLCRPQPRAGGTAEGLSDPENKEMTWISTVDRLQAVPRFSLSNYRAG